MRILPTAILLAFPMTAPADAGSLQDRVPVAIQLVGDDGLTQKLHAALDAELNSDSELRQAKEGDSVRLSITSDTNVGWDKLGGRTVAIYTVHLAEGTYRSGPVTGICYASGMSKCAKDILRRARSAIAFEVRAGQ